MTKRQMVYGLICFLVGVLVGMEIAGMIDVLVRIVLIVAILLLLGYLALPYLPLRTSLHKSPVQQRAQRRTKRKP